MIIGYIFASVFSICAIVAAYCLEFVGRAGFGIVPDTSIWGGFGSYVGGLASPILSFISLLFLIQSLKLQNKANEALRSEVKANQHSEKLNSFSDLFFHMIDSQRSLLEKFELNFTKDRVVVNKRGVDAIMNIETKIGDLRQANATNQDLKDFINEIDTSDQVFGIVRAFYISVKMVIEKLSDAQGFSIVERKDFLNTLINFTDFAQIRLVLLGMQMLDTKAVRYLRSEQDFLSVLDDVGLQLDPY